MSPLPATRRSFLPWASWSPPRSRVFRTIPVMPVPVSPLRSSRSSALEGPCPSHRGKPWWRGPMGSLRWFTRSPAAEAGGERRRQWGSQSRPKPSLKPNPSATPFQRGGGNPLPRPDRAAAEAVVEGLGGATGVCPKSTVVMSGSAMPPVGVLHPKVESFPRRAPRGSSPTFMGYFNVKERSEERLLGWPRRSFCGSACTGRSDLREQGVRKLLAQRWTALRPLPDLPPSPLHSDFRGVRPVLRLTNRCGSESIRSPRILCRSASFTAPMATWAT
jgi:hypothetical protein